MDIKDLAIPEVYRESADFRFFLKWFSECLSRTTYDTENFFDLYDPLRCPEDLIWALADTMGYKFDSRLPASFNRLVLLYFMSMIRNRGSKDGVTLAAEANLAQFHILMDAAGYTDEDGNEVPGKDILYNRLEDTSIPVNSVYVTPHTESGFIDVVYYSTRVPTDACIEYVRPLGMYLFQHAGVDFQARTKISIDARLTDERDRTGLSDNFGPTQVGHYTRYDYSSLQKDPSVISKNLSDMTQWSLSTRPFTFTREYDKSSNVTTVNARFNGNHERVFVEVPVKPNSIYTVKFKLKLPQFNYTYDNDPHGYTYVLPGTTTSLNLINNAEQYISQVSAGCLGRSDGDWVRGTEDFVSYEFAFESKDNTSVYLVFDFGQVPDNTNYIFYFSDMTVSGYFTNYQNHLRDRVWSRNSEAERRKAYRDEINPGYRSLYSLQLANNEQIMKSLIDPIFSLGYGPQEIGVTYPDDYLKPEYVDRYEGGTMKTMKKYANISNLSNWSSNYLDRWTFNYDTRTRMNITQLRTSGGWERIYILQPVTENSEYRLSIKFNHPTAYSGTGVLPAFVCPTSSLSKIEQKDNVPYNNIPKLSDMIELPAEATDGTIEYHVDFSTGDNSEVYVVIDGGGRSDNRTDNFEIGDIRLGQLIDGIVKPWNLRYDRDLEESIRGDSVMDDPTSEPDIYTVEDRENPSTIVRPLPAVNPIMSKMGDAISLDPLNTRYISTKESDESDIHVEEVSTDG